MHQKIYLLIISLVLGLQQAFSVSPEETLARQKIDTLNSLIVEVEGMGLDATKEKMTIRTAEVFLKYAEWDEENIAENTGHFKMVSRYKDNAEEMATILPKFERDEIIIMLDDAIDFLHKLKSGDYLRKPIQKLDWNNIKHEGDQLTHNGKPVFIEDYIWKPSTSELSEYYGNFDGVYLDQSKVTNADGDINYWTMKNLNERESNSIGYVFLGNKGVLDWTLEEYGADFRLPIERYTVYDIDNTGALELNELLLKSTVPLTAGKKNSELGYMLCNEPHFYTTKTGDKVDWASGEVTSHTKEKFKLWLKDKHASIQALNTLWGSSFASFDDVTIEIPIDRSLIGTPKWYDWITFNCFRVTQWYTNLKGIVRKYDPNGKVHLKIIPNHWAGSYRGQGIDVEALTELSDIIGHDAGAQDAPMWGEHEWQEYYGFEWRDIFMSMDFLKSVSPEKLSFNSETHYLSGGRSRDLYQKPEYARACFWASATQGISANQIWFWARLADGSVKSNPGNGYAGSNNHQPRIVNEIASVHMDLNTHADVIMAMQRQRKPIRIFHSETSATNKAEHMEDVYEVYERCNFEGVPVGFVTKNIIQKQDNSSWDVVLVHKTEFVTPSELDALQSYLNNGGTVIIDNVSLLKDEYGRPITPLTKGDGNLIKVSSLDQMYNETFALIEQSEHSPAVKISEKSNIGKKTCAWKCVEDENGNPVLSIVNLGKSAVELVIKPKNIAPFVITDMLNGTTVNDTVTIPKFGVLFYKISPYKALPETPTTPQNLNVSNISKNGCVLRWSASKDKDGVAGYIVKQDGVYLQTVTSTYAQISDLACNTNYSFSVIALDNDENQSDISSSVSVTTAECMVTSFEVGNDFSNGETVDGWSSNMVINETDTYINTTGAEQNFTLDNFNFYALRKSDPITPFVVKVNGDNDFTVLAIGTTRTNSDYVVGSNSVKFSASPTKLALADGDTIAIGFLDANADGTGGGSSSVISFDQEAEADEIWYTGGKEGSTSGSVLLNAEPTPGESAITTLKRTYHFGISLFNSNMDKPKPKVYFMSPIKNSYAVADSNLFVKIGAQSETGIAHVQLFLNNELVGQKEVAPFQWGKDNLLMQNMKEGVYTLKAIAKDFAGITNETSLQVSVAAAQKPTVSFQTPLHNSEFYQGSDLNITIDAFSNFGIANVKLYVNETLLGQKILPPFSWGEKEPLLQNLPTGNYTLKAVAENALGLRADTSIYISVASNTNVNVIEADNSLKVFPNPAKHQFTIKSKEAGTYKLFDIQGRICKQKEQKSKKHTVQVSDLQSGLYILQFKSDKGYAIQKLELQ
ncbi:Ig-like domain-containing protein [Labilibacter marinus]|uniref:Ig-like domain-containing protein n=1 Tax=Labilibacter marinus TaxID=1477105 RepID=UPI000950002F|nr:Ig-like domain-containing protein [Labilibacter marinus]